MRIRSEALAFWKNAILKTAPVAAPNEFLKPLNSWDRRIFLDRSRIFYEYYIINSRYLTVFQWKPSIFNFFHWKLPIVNYCPLKTSGIQLFSITNSRLPTVYLWKLTIFNWFSLKTPTVTCLNLKTPDI